MGKSVQEEEKPKKSRAVKKPGRCGGTREMDRSGDETEEGNAKSAKDVLGKYEKDSATSQGKKKELRRAMKGELEKNGKALAASLVQRAIGGDTRTTAMMLSMMDKKEQGEDGKRQGPTVADLLEAEPEWNGLEDEQPDSV